MRPAAGRRDTLITLQEQSRTQNPNSGTWGYTWANLSSNPTEWADVEQLGVSRGEFVADSIVLSVRKYRIEILYREDITSDMQVVLPDGTELEITSPPQELGRREGLRLMCEAHSTEGNQE